MPEPGPPAGADRVLRPVLELAFDVARVGARSSPPIEAPRAVKPFLNFQGRLPDSALVALRRGLDEDDAFRDRVAGLADEGELGRAGWLLVARPDGWEDDLARILDDAGANARAEQEEKEERSARRKLAHAEEARARAETAAARSRAELAAATTELVAERRARRSAQDEATQLGRRVGSLEGERDSARRKAADSGADVADLRTELDAAQREVTRLAAALEAAEAEVAALALKARADQLRAGAAGGHPGAVSGESRGGGRTPATGPAAPSAGSAGGGSAGTAPGVSGGATRAGGAPVSPAARGGSTRAGGAPVSPAALGGAARAGGGPDLRLVADAVSAAAAAASTLGRALADASAAMAPPSSAPAPAPPPARPEGRTAAPRRRPIGLPPAVFDDTTDAAAHLVRVPGALLLVDGYNAAKLLWPEQAPLELRERLVDALSELVARTGAFVHVVYDGADLGLPPSGPTSSRGVRVSFSPHDVEADDVILDLVDAEPTGRVVVVASSDRRVADGARRRGANVISSAQLAAVLGRS